MRTVVLIPLLLSCHAAPGETDRPVPISDTETEAEDTAAEVIDEPREGLCRVELVCPDEVADEPKIGCDISILDADGESLYTGVAGVELRGRSSLHFPKPQYGLELREWQETLLPLGSTWRYWDGASAPSGDWTALDYDDSAWQSGAAPLGYGDDEETEISYGSDANDKHITAWFRVTFEVEELDADETLLSVVRDDGVVAYLDGEEVLRDNLAEGAGHGDWAEEALSGDDETTAVTAEVATLEAGTHVLAIAVHQANPTSSDLRLDAQLDAIGPEVDVDLFGMGAESDWILNGAYVDRALFRNAMLYDLFQDMEAVPADSEPLPEGSRYASESVFCTLSLDGEERGIHVLGERVKRGADRVDIDKDGRSGESFIIKLDDRESRGGFHENGVGYGTWRAVFPKEDDASDEALATMRTALEDWEDAHWSSDTHAVFAHLDLDSAVDWVLLQELSKNNDAYFLSVHLWRDVGGKMHMLPWDMDLTFGYPYTDCSAEGWVDNRQEWVEELARDEAFTDRFEARWWELRDTVLTEEALLGRVDDAVATLEPALDANEALWPVDEIAFSWGDVDNWLCPVDSYDEEVARVRTFLSDRLVWMDAHIDDF